jgi:hypothetical protein
LAWITASKRKALGKPGAFFHHLMAGIPRSVNFELIAEKGFDPKKPRYADNGLGCAEVITISS